MRAPGRVTHAVAVGEDVDRDAPVDDGDVVACDVLDDAALVAAIAKTEKDLGPLDGLATIVGMAYMQNSIDLPMENWDTDHRRNLRRGGGSEAGQARGDGGNRPRRGAGNLPEDILKPLPVRRVENERIGPGRRPTADFGTGQASLAGTMLVRVAVMAPGAFGHEIVVV